MPGHPQHDATTSNVCQMLVADIACRCRGGTFITFTAAAYVQVQHLVVVPQAPMALPDQEASETSLGRLRNLLTWLLCLLLLVSRRCSTLWWCHRPLWHCQTKRRLRLA
jgi:hypothetical protein